MSDKVSRFVKAGAAILACGGVLVTPEQSEIITAGFMAIYAIVSTVQAKLAK